jgi:hypothetical protein
MSINKKQRNTLIITILLSAIIMRLIPHIPNFAPITAAAIFSAAYLPKKYIFIIPLLAVAVSDYLLLYINPFGNPMFNFSELQPLGALVNNTTAWVWGSFMISALLGLLLRKKRGAIRIGSVTMLASLQFFLITNFGVWAAGAYARDLSGLVASYVAGLPFLNWTVLGDLFYTFSFFALYAIVAKGYGSEAKVPKSTSKPAQYLN